MRHLVCLHQVDQTPVGPGTPHERFPTPSTPTPATPVANEPSAGGSGTDCKGCLPITPMYVYAALVCSSS